MMVRGILAAMAVSIAVAPATAQSGNWLTTVAETNGGHRIGNPDAKVKLVEFVSYTCSHCASFTRESEGALKVGYIGTGNVSVEVRHLIRDPVDLTVAMLANCGPASKFPQNHTAFMVGQAEWMAPASRATPAQRQRWTAGEPTARRQAIANDLRLYSIMEGRGYGRAEVDRCLADEAMASKLAEHSAADWKIPGIGGTPAFSINGSVLANVHSWPILQQRIRQAL